MDHSLQSDQIQESVQRLKAEEPLPIQVKIKFMDSKSTITILAGDLNKPPMHTYRSCPEAEIHCQLSAAQPEAGSLASDSHWAFSSVNNQLPRVQDYSIFRTLLKILSKIYSHTKTPFFAVCVVGLWHGEKEGGAKAHADRPNQVTLNQDTVPHVAPTQNTHPPFSLPYSNDMFESPPDFKIPFQPLILMGNEGWEPLS